MSAEGLIDTGAILAILDRNDRWHRACLHAAQNLPLPLLTSEAVLAEVFHLSARRRLDAKATWKLVRSGILVLATMEQRDLTALESLMEQYRKLPMDFADATLVYLARREGRSAILTVDRRDFATYRIEGRRRFRIYPTTTA